MSRFEPLPASLYVEILAKVKQVLGEYLMDDALQVVEDVEAGVIRDYQEEAKYARRK